MIRRAGIVLMLSCLVLFAASFAGALHPIGDSLSVFRYLIAFGVMTGAILAVRGWRRSLGVVVLTLAVFIEPLAASLSPLFVGPRGTYSLYQKNMFYQNDDHDGLIRDIDTLAPDFVTLQEVAGANMPVYRHLVATFETAALCSRSGRASLAVMSQFPSTGKPPICSDQAGFLAVQVETPDGPVWLAAIHLRWPWPKEQAQNVEAIVPILAELDGPIIMAGDFNAVPWSYAMIRLARASRTERVGPILRTLVGISPFLRIPIDHVLVPGGQGTLQTRPELGSDHLGLLATFNL